MYIPSQRAATLTLGGEHHVTTETRFDLCREIHMAVVDSLNLSISLYHGSS